MMTDQEWKELSEIAEDWQRNIDAWVHRDSRVTSLFLAAYRELKDRREDEEWLKRYNCTIGFGWDGVFVQQFVGGRNGNEGQGPTLHAAVTAAKETR